MPKKPKHGVRSVTYVPQTVKLDGVGFARSAGLAISDSPTGLLSVWLKDADLLSSFSMLMALANYYVQIDAPYRNNNGRFQVNLGDANGSYFSNVGGDNQAAAGWENYLLHWDVGQSAGFKRVYFARTGVLGPGMQVTGDESDPFTIAYSGNSCSVFADAESPPSGFPVVEVCDFQFWAGVNSIDLGNPSTIELFIDANRRPVDPAVAAAYYGPQAILFSGGPSTFGTNQGNGGAFVQVGGGTVTAGSAI